MNHNRVVCSQGEASLASPENARTANAVLGVSSSKAPCASPGGAVEPMDPGTPGWPVGIRPETPTGQLQGWRIPMASAEITRRWPDGDELTVRIDVEASYPDAVAEAKQQAVNAFADALEVALAEVDEDE